MRRTAALMLGLVMIFLGIPCAAESGFYCEYTPKTENSTVFYIDVYTTVEISAAVMELSFDRSMVEYREASAVEKSSAVRAASENGVVKLALADSGARKGKLCRVAFKALQAGACVFRLHISQASDGEPRSIGGFSDSSIEVKLGKDDVVEDSAVKTSAKASSVSGKHTSGSRSSLREASERDEPADATAGGWIDLRKSDSLKFLLIGAGIVILIAALVITGIILGKKSAAKPQNTEADAMTDDRLTENGTDTEDHTE